MRKLWRDLSLRNKLLTAMLCCGLVPLVATMVAADRRTAAALEQQAFNQLTSLLAVKQGQVERYFSQIHQQVRELAESTMTQDAMRDLRAAFYALPDDLAAVDAKRAAQDLRAYYSEQFAAQFKNTTGRPVEIEALLPSSPPQLLAQYLYIADNPRPLGSKDEFFEHADDSRYSRTHARFHPRLRSFLKRFGYYDIFLVDAARGDVVYTTFKELDFGTNLKHGPYRDTGLGAAFQRAAEAEPGSSVLVDFEPYLPSYDAAASFIAAPIHDGPELLGVLVFQMPVGEINALMEQRAGLGETGETYLVGDDRLMRSQSRFSKEPTLFRRKVDTVAVAAALAGESGAARIKDYRGIDVLSAYTPLAIEGVKWAMLAEADTGEALAAVAAQQRTAGFIALAAALAIGLFAYVLAAELARRVRHAAVVADRIAHGNFDNAIELGARDEIGELSAALERMQSVLFKQITAEKEQALQLKDSVQAEKDEALRLSQSIQDEKEAAARLNQALESAATAIMLVDVDGSVSYTNPTMRRMLERHASSLRTTADPRAYAALCAHMSELRALTQGTPRVEARHAALVFSVAASAVRTLDGKPAGHVLEWHDISEQRAAEDAIKQVLSAATEGILDERVESAGLSGFTAWIASSINQLLDAITRPISQTNLIMRALANGDLARTMDGGYRGEFAALSDSVNTCIDNLRSTIGTLHDSIARVAASAQEISRGNQELSRRTEDQALNLQRTASAMEQLTSTVNQNADNSNQAGSISQATAERAHNGGTVVENAVNSMSGIQSSSSKIADIIGVIDEIAFQTNLLALNAAVEAARAGEQGRGFAVVAAEVRALAQRSAAAAKEIKTLIKDSVSKVDVGATLVRESGSQLEQIVRDVGNVSTIVQDIANASREQATGLAEINTSVSGLDAITQQNSALVEQIAAASESLHQDAIEMQTQIAFFKLGGKDDRHADGPTLEVYVHGAVA